MKKGMFVGTFDPPTLGHADIITRGTLIFDELYVGLAENPSKPLHFFSSETRKKILEEIVQPLRTVHVHVISGLVVDFAVKEGVQFLLRGLRPGFDSTHEFSMAHANREMAGLETLFLISTPAYAHISSSLIRDIVSAGGSAKGFVPEEVLRELARRR